MAVVVSVGTAKFCVCNYSTLDGSLEDKGAKSDAPIYAVNIGNICSVRATQFQLFLLIPFQSHFLKMSCKD